MNEIFARNILYWGEDFQNKLANAHVAVFGLGGVGGFCAEALARSGVGGLTLIDFDKVSKTNINRQIIALNSTVGMPKTELFEKRLKDINPEIKLNLINDFFTDVENFCPPCGGNAQRVKGGRFGRKSGEGFKIDYVADAIDTMRSKINLLTACVENKIPVISSMGAGNRMKPEMLYISDISDIHDKKAPFVSQVLYQLKKRGITSGITVVTSDEKPFVQEKITEQENITTQSGEEIQFNKIVPSSTPFVASTAGIFMASRIVSDIITNKQGK